MIFPGALISLPDRKNSKLASVAMATYNFALYLAFIKLDMKLSGILSSGVLDETLLIRLDRNLINQLLQQPKL